jgi:hypothetical protein
MCTPSSVNENSQILVKTAIDAVCTVTSYDWKEGDIEGSFVDQFGGCVGEGKVICTSRLYEAHAGYSISKYLGRHYIDGAD